MITDTGERQLVTIREISRIDPIPNADNIEVATVDGWKCIVKKNTFNVGDRALYFEIDSFIPIEDERFSFLSDRASTLNGVVGSRIKTIKLRGQISQGLLLPLTDFPEVTGEALNIAEKLGVTKYEAPLPFCLQGYMKGYFPRSIRRTDQERIQNIWGSLTEEDKATTYEKTIKMDGSSMTVYCDGRDYGVCSRKIDMVETDANTFWKVAKSERLLDGLRYLCDKTQQSLAFQGELCGPGIQGNRHKLTEPGFYLYDIWSITRQEYLTINEKYDLLYALDYQKDGISVKHVGVVGFVNLSGMTMNDLLEDADKENGNIEGYVYKKAANPRLSFKVISNKYLLKHGE